VAASNSQSANEFGEGTPGWFSRSKLNTCCIEHAIVVKEWRKNTYKGRRKIVIIKKLL
jgi:hypothetical protein